MEFPILFRGHFKDTIERFRYRDAIHYYRKVCEVIYILTVLKLYMTGLSDLCYCIESQCL